MDATNAAQSVSLQKLTVGRPVVPLVHRQILRSNKDSFGTSSVGDMALNSSFVRIGT